jgi:tetratricopeptide (TPR) repeat protein
MSINEQIQKLEKEIVSPIVDHLMATEYAVAPPDPLVPEKVWKERMRGELTTFLSGKEVMRRVDSASELLIHYIRSNLSEVEIQELAKEWELGVERMNDLFEKKIEEPVETIPVITLQKMMNLSEKSLGIFYAAGVKLYEEQDYIKSADVFFLLTLIDYQRHNIWLSLGLSELKNKHFELALNAFAMATVTKAASPLPYIYSAECCIALERKEEASAYLALARDGLNALPVGQREGLLRQINILEQQAK